MASAAVPTFTIEPSASSAAQAVMAQRRPSASTTGPPELPRPISESKCSTCVPTSAHWRMA